MQCPTCSIRIYATFAYVAVPDVGQVSQPGYQCPNRKTVYDLTGKVVKVATPKKKTKVGK